MSHKPSNHCGKCKLVIHNRAVNALYCKPCAYGIRLHRSRLRAEITHYRGFVQRNQMKLRRMADRTMKLRLEK
jgi:translation initiation factor RLI1